MKTISKIKQVQKSAKISLKITPALREQIEKTANKNNRTLSNMVEIIVEDHIGEY